MDFFILAWLFGLIIALLIIWKWAWPTYNRWSVYRKKLSEIEDKHEEIRKRREDLLVILGVIQYHYDWQVDNGEDPSEIEKDIRSADITLTQLEHEYKQTKKNGMKAFDKSHVY